MLKKVIMKKILKLKLAGIVIALFFVSCEYLDKEFDASLNEMQVFTDEALSRQFLNNVYSFIPNEFSGDIMFGGGINAFFDCATDNGTQPGMHTAIDLFQNSSLTPTDNPQDFWWSRLFTAIRKASKYIDYADIVPADNKEIPGDDANRLRDRYKAEARLLRAFYHFELMKRWGAVPIVNKTLTMADDLNMLRRPVSEVVDYIVSECDIVIPDLPLVYNDPANAGRVSGAMAMALKSRALLYAASPLFNTENDIGKWTEAALAAKQLMDKNVFSLYNNYAELFTTMHNNEIIFSCHPQNNRSVETHNSPTGYTDCVGYSNPSQNLVDAYEMNNGLPVSDANSGYDPQNPYVNRDPRFEQTIIHNGSEWFYREVEIFEGGRDRSSNITTKTGYYVRKWLNPNVYTTSNTFVNQYHMWIHFRYGEILLNYAEAQNEAAGPDASVYAAINEIRSRQTVNMPPLPDGLSREEMRERIQNERRIELAFESHWYYDVRRWKMGDHYLSVPLRGVRISKNGENLSYTYEDVEQRNFMDKNYLFPIPFEEWIKAPNLGQNPGYEIE